MPEDFESTLKARLVQDLDGEPDLLASVLEVFSEAELLREFVSAVDESVFGLVDWIKAHRVLMDWLEERGLVLPLVDQINYLSCVAEAGSPGMALEDLPALIKDMLATYGCERAIKKP